MIKVMQAKVLLPIKYIARFLMLEINATSRRPLSWGALGPLLVRFP